MLDATAGMQIYCIDCSIEGNLNAVDTELIVVGCIVDLVYAILRILELEIAELIYE